MSLRTAPCKPLTAEEVAEVAEDSRVEFAAVRAEFAEGLFLVALVLGVFAELFSVFSAAASALSAVKLFFYWQPFYGPLAPRRLPATRL